jgi:DNA mismatch repair ATPase MutS
MAGKSTLLKAVGLNVILAHAGAPIRAARARLASFSVCSSNSISDSLLDGKSKFLAEAERLHRILQKTGLERPVLFLIDEILSGPNSHDRRIACESVVRALVAGGAIGILSTHDLALTSIAELPELRGMNCCMESDDPGDPLNFDYRVKPGASRRNSALAIMKMIGIDALGPPTNTGS